jgi:hypothetical protein
MAQEWNIRSRAHACQGCGQAFRDRQPCVSALFDAASGYERRDYCPACWEQPRPPDDPQPFSVWQGEFREPEKAAREEPVRRETAESLLRRLIALEDPAKTNVVYVLAVMLERSRQLVERDVRPHESGGLLRVYEHRRSGDTFIVLDPRLRIEAIGEVQRQVIAMLESGATA